MKNWLLILAGLFLFAGLSAAQVTTSAGGWTVTAADGDSHCVFVGPQIVDSGTITCFHGKLEELFTHWHVSIGTSVTGSFVGRLHTISWTLTHVSDGIFTWSISLDGGPPITGTF